MRKTYAIKSVIPADLKEEEKKRYIEDYKEVTLAILFKNIVKECGLKFSFEAEFTQRIHANNEHRIKLKAFVSFPSPPHRHPRGL